MSFAGALMDWAAATTGEAGPLPLESSFTGMGSVAKTGSWLWEVTFTSKGSLGTVGGLVTSRTTPLVVSFFSSMALVCPTSLEGSVEEGRISVGLSLSSSDHLAAVSTLGFDELGRVDSQIVGG